MTPHSSENLMERAKLTEAEIDAAFIEGTAKKPYDLQNPYRAVAHAQRVKMAQAVVAWLDEMIEHYRYTATEAIERSPAQKTAFAKLDGFVAVKSALQAQLEAEAQK